MSDFFGFGSSNDDQNELEGENRINNATWALNNEGLQNDTRNRQHYLDAGQTYGQSFGQLSTAAGKAQAQAQQRNSGQFLDRGNLNIAQQGTADMGAMQRAAFASTVADANALGSNNSAAQAQLAQATNANINDQLAMARSGRGLGGSAAASRQSAFGAAAAGQQAANQSALLRMQGQEQQLQGMGQAAQIANQYGAGQQAYGLGAAQYTTGAQQNAQNENDQLALNYGQLQANTMGQGAQAQFAGYQGEAAANEQRQQSLLGQMGAGNQQMSTAAGEEIADQQGDEKIAGGMISAAGGMMAMSDTDEKKDKAEQDGIAKGFAQAMENMGAGIQGREPQQLKSRGTVSDAEPATYAQQGSLYGPSATYGTVDYSPYGGRYTDPTGVSQIARDTSEFGIPHQELPADRFVQHTPVMPVWEPDQATVASYNPSGSYERPAPTGPISSTQLQSYLANNYASSDSRAKKDAIYQQGVADTLRGIDADESEFGPTYGAAPHIAPVDVGALDAAQRRLGGPVNDLRGAPGYSYRYKDPNAPGAAPGVQVGPMAQDLEKTAARGAVVNTPQGKMVDTGRLTLTNTSAIGEVQRDMDELRARVDAEERKKGRAVTPAPSSYSAELGANPEIDEAAARDITFPGQTARVPVVVRGDRYSAPLGYDPAIDRAAYRDISFPVYGGP